MDCHPVLAHPCSPLPFLAQCGGGFFVQGRDHKSQGQWLGTLCTATGSPLPNARQVQTPLHSTGRASIWQEGELEGTVHPHFTALWGSLPATALSSAGVPTGAQVAQFFFFFFLAEIIGNVGISQKK